MIYPSEGDFSVNCKLFLPLLQFSDDVVNYIKQEVFFKEGIFFD